jgi:Rab-GTPase-TBC domain
LVQYAKRGVPPTLRQRIYKKILYCDITQKKVDYFASLHDNVQRWESAIDDTVFSDIFFMCNDDKYFIFQDMIEMCLLPFFRDKQVLDLIKSRPNSPMVVKEGLPNAGDKNPQPFPQCGVIPIKKFSYYITPLCYISNSKEDVYYIFRGMYCKYFCYLNSISSHPQSIVSLCKLFEDLLQMFEPEVCYHLAQLGANPLKIAFYWIVYAFVGVLEPDQIYLLWDRILGFESLEILPIFAASVFVFRANLILNCQT